MKRLVCQDLHRIVLVQVTFHLVLNSISRQYSPLNMFKGKGKGKRTADMAFKSNATDFPFMPMFEQLRDELDEHHDRRERTIKASRDITAASKKM